MRLVAWESFPAFGGIGKEDTEENEEEVLLLRRGEEAICSHVINSQWAEWWPQAF